MDKILRWLRPRAARHAATTQNLWHSFYSSMISCISSQKGSHTFYLFASCCTTQLRRNWHELLNNLFAGSLPFISIVSLYHPSPCLLSLLEPPPFLFFSARACEPERSERCLLYVHPSLHSLLHNFVNLIFLASLSLIFVDSI